jgi:hypothetical protein
MNYDSTLPVKFKQLGHMGQCVAKGFAETLYELGDDAVKAAFIMARKCYTSEESREEFCTAVFEEVLRLERGE